MTSSAAPKKHSRARRWLKRGAITLVCLPIALPVLVLALLAIPLTRRPVLALALDLTNDALAPMRIELDAVERLDLWGIELSGARFFLDGKREMVSVAKARVRIAPFALVTGTLSLTDAAISGTRIHLYSVEDEEEEEEEDDGEPSSFQILAHRLSVKDLTFDMDLSGKALHAVLSELSAHGAYGPKTRATIEKLALEAELDGQHAAELHSEYVLWDEQKGGKAALSGDLLGAALRIVYVVPAITDSTRWPLRRAELHLTDLRSEGLARVGYAELAQLRAPVSLHVQARTSGAQDELLSGELALLAGKARLSLKASASPSTYALDLALPPADLAQVSGILPELRAGVHLSVTARHDVTPISVEAKWDDVSLDGRAVPSGSLRALLPLPVIKLESLALAGLGQALSLRGDYDTSNNAAHVLLAANELNLASFGGLLPPGSQGALNGSLRASYAPNKLSAQGALSLRYLRMSDLAIDNTSLALDVAGAPTDPRGQVKVEAQQIVQGETKIARVAVLANAGLHDLDGSVQVDGVDRSLSLVLTGTRADDGTLTVNGGGKGRIKDKQVGIKVLDLQIAADRYSVQELSAFSGKERLYVSGALQGDTVDASLQVAQLNLAPWSRLFLSDEIRGLLDLSARAGGNLRAPKLDLSLGVRGLHAARAPRAPAVDLQTKLAFDAAKRKASLLLETHSQDRRVALTLSAEAELARAQALALAFSRASLKLDLKGHTDVPFLAQFAEAQLGALDGDVSADISISGDMDEAEMYAKFASELVPRVEQGKSPPDRVDLDIVLKPASLDVDLIVQDKFGRAVDLSTQAKLPAGGPRALIAQGSALMHVPVTLKLLVNERRLDKLQGSLGVLTRTYGAALPVRVKAQVDVESTGQAIHGKVLARAHLWGEGLDDACGENAEGELTLDTKLGGDLVEAVLTAEPSGGGKAEVKLKSKLGVNSLLDGGAFAWGPATLSAQGDALVLNTLPFLCMLPDSRTSLRLQAENLGKTPIVSTLALEVKDIATSEGAVGLKLDVASTPDAIKAQGKLLLSGRDKGSFTAKVPLAYGDSPLPTVPLDQPFSAALDLPDFPLAGLASFTDAVGRVGGRLRANVQLGGTLRSPDPAGVIELKDAAFAVASLAQPFSGVDARFELAPDKVVIRKLKARDRAGKLGLVGYASYNEARGGAAEVHLSADKFPIRQQGSIIGELTTRAVLEAKIDPEQKMSLDLNLKEGRIWLTGKGGRQVQELDEHPDVRFDTDRTQELVDEAMPASESGPTLVLFRIRSSKDLWLMHEDFAVQVGVDMKLTTGEEGVTLGGEANITRGDLNLLGKPFRLERGAIRFTGDVPPDPELDLKAKHTTRQGQTLIVQIQGRASEPQIVFSGAASNAGEAAALLTGIGSSSADSKAKGDAANFAAGLTAGLLAVSARRRFGDWVPMLAIESNAQGGPSGARAGFDASRLIPEFMRGFARGMFVEGVVGSRSGTPQGGSGVGVGVRVEVALPRDFMTAMGYGPGTVWSTDVYWSP
jgi:autotransporter translocation and assembly factor TamB